MLFNAMQCRAPLVFLHAKRTHACHNVKSVAVGIVWKTGKFSKAEDQRLITNIESWCQVWRIRCNTLHTLGPLTSRVWNAVSGAWRSHAATRIAGEWRHGSSPAGLWQAPRAPWLLEGSGYAISTRPCVCSCLLCPLRFPRSLACPLKNVLQVGSLRLGFYVQRRVCSGRCASLPSARERSCTATARRWDGLQKRRT
jgi:hypothetical protein